MGSPVLPALHEKFAEGEPKQSSDGLFVRPFLKNDEYKAFIRQMFIDEKQFHGAAQKALYTDEWVSPWSAVKSVEDEENADNADEGVVEDDETEETQRTGYGKDENEEEEA